MALAANEIEEWGDREIGEFEIVGSVAIVIKAGGAFHFHATDPEDPTGLGVINSVTVDANAQIEGPIYLYIHRDPNDVGGDPCSPGAKAVYTMDLTANSAAGHLVYLNVLYNLGYFGGTVVDYADTIVVGTDLYDLTAIDITGPVTVSGWLRGTVDCYSIMDFTVLGGSESTSNVLVGSCYGYDMYINGPMDRVYIGDAEHAANLTGSILVRGDVDELVVFGSLAGDVQVGAGQDPPVYCAGIGMRDMPETGSVTVYGDVRLFDVSGDNDPYYHGDLAGAVSITGSLVLADVSGVLVSDSITPTAYIHIGGELESSITAAEYLAGEVEIDGNVPWNDDEEPAIECGRLSGSVTVNGLFNDWLCVNGYQGSGPLSGTVHLANVGPHGWVSIPVGDLSGQVIVDQHFQEDAALECSGDLTGTIVLGDLSGAVYIDGLLSDPDDDATRYQGSIQVIGALRSTGVIEVGGLDYSDPCDPADFSEFITCADYDGYDGDPNQKWEIGGTVHIVSPDRTWTQWPGPWNGYNHPWNFHVFATTCCVADVNGDQVRNFADVNAYVDALESFDDTEPYPDPNSLFGRNWPGRAGSWYHADCDGDERVTFADTDDFVALLNDGNCPVDCPSEDRGDGLPDYEPAELAKQFRAHVTPDRLDTLAIAIGHVATAEKGDRKQYWTQVYAELTK